MKLEPPLLNLIARCQTICVAECCGIDAYDLSPIQIASYLTMYRGKPDASEVRTLRGQIDALPANYGLAGASGRGVTLKEINQSFTAEQVEVMTNELLANLDAALSLIEKSEELRYRITNPRFTEWRPGGAVWQFGSRWRAAIGELIVRFHASQETAMPWELIIVRYPGAPALRTAAQIDTEVPLGTLAEIRPY